MCFYEHLEHVLVDTLIGGRGLSTYCRLTPDALGAGLRGPCRLRSLISQSCVSNVQIIDYRDMGLLYFYFGGSGVVVLTLSNIVRVWGNFVSKKFAFKGILCYN